MIIITIITTAASNENMSLKSIFKHAVLIKSRSVHRPPPSLCVSPSPSLPLSLSFSLSVSPSLYGIETPMSNGSEHGQPTIKLLTETKRGVQITGGDSGTVGREVV